VNLTGSVTKAETVTTSLVAQTINRRFEVGRAPPRSTQRQIGSYAQRGPVSCFRLGFFKKAGISKAFVGIAFHHPG
jgi:hypothetical protein